MFKLHGAVIKEQGVTFAIVVVKPHVVNSQTESEKLALKLGSIFPGMPIILMSQDGRGVPTYRGRKDIVSFLGRLQVSQIPWKEYTYN